MYRSLLILLAAGLLSSCGFAKAEDLKTVEARVDKLEQSITQLKGELKVLHTEIQALKENYRSLEKTSKKMRILEEALRIFVSKIKEMEEPAASNTKKNSKGAKKLSPKVKAVQEK